MLFPSLKEKAFVFHVSKELFVSDFVTESEHLQKIIRLSNNQNEFRINMEGEVYNSLEIAPFDFSYLLGLQFGVYNLYQSEVISTSVKKELVLANPNRDKTYQIMKNNYQAIASYLCVQYDTSKEFIFQTMEEMFCCHGENPNFSNSIALDIGKMITAYYSYFRNKSIQSSLPISNYFFESGQAMMHFERLNEIEKFHK